MGYELSRWAKDLDHPCLTPNPPKSRVISSGAWVKDAARWRFRYDADAGAI